MLNAKHIRAWGIILLALGAVVLAMLGEGIPDRSRLTEVTGPLRSLEKSTSRGGGHSSVRFSLTTDPRYFLYSSKAGAIDKVWNALEKAGHSEIGVLFDPADSHSLLLEDRVYYTAFELRIGNEMIQPYAKVVASWNADNTLGAGLGYGATGIGIALLVVGFLKRRQRP